jgi:putative ABC transport system ATP-binding protein
MSSVVLGVRNLTKQYGAGVAAVRAVDDVSVDIGMGEIVVIMGPSGSGKTTLLSMMGGLMRPTSGQVYHGEAEIWSLSEAELPRIRARRIGFVFQAFNLLDALTVEENILLPAQLAPGGVRGAHRRMEEVVDRLDLGERRRAFPATLSGGEKQRVAIARALINRPPLILADEPTGNLDSQKGMEVGMILHDLARDEGVSVVVVTHDPRVEDVANRVLWLEDGRIRDRRSEVHSWVRDPVCGMKVDEWTAGHRLEYAGQRHAFCSQRCLDRFRMAPSSYVSVRPAGSGRRDHERE